MSAAPPAGKCLAAHGRGGDCRCGAGAVVGVISLRSIASTSAEQARRSFQAAQVALQRTATSVANTLVTDQANQAAAVTSTTFAIGATQTKIVQFTLATTEIAFAGAAIYRLKTYD